MSEEPKSKKIKKNPPKKGVIAAVLAVALVLFVGSGYAVYALWYQNPEKVVIDSMVSAVLAKTAKTSGNVTIEYNDFVFAVQFDGEGGSNEGNSGSGLLTIKNKKLATDIEIKGRAVIAKNGDVYFKVNDLKKVYSNALTAIVGSQVEMIKKQGQTLTNDQAASIRQAYDSLLGSVITKIGEKWIKFSVDDIRSVNPKISKEYTCIQDTVKQVTEDKKLLDEVAAIYAKNKFLVIKENLGVRDGSVGYMVDIDKEIGKTFNDAFKETVLYKKLSECSSNLIEYLESGLGELGSNDNNTTSSKARKIQVWANQWSHQLTQFKAVSMMSNNKDSGKFAVNIDIRPQINAPVTVTIPKDTVPFKEITSSLSVRNSATTSAEKSSRP